MHVFFLHNKKKTSRAKTDDKQNNFRTERTDTERLLGHLRTHGVLRYDDRFNHEAGRKNRPRICFSQIEGMSEIIRWLVVLTGAEYRTHENDDIISLSLTGYSDSKLVDCWHKPTETIEFASEDS